jgi:hypothetical protein
MKSQLHQ